MAPVKPLRLLSGMPTVDQLRAAVDKYAESPAEHRALTKIIDVIERNPPKPKP